LAVSAKSIVISLTVFILLVVGASLLLTAGQRSEPQVASYTTASNDKPMAEIKEAFFDFGEIKVSDVKQKDFALKNTGTKPLQILNVNSSCGCTTGQIIYDGTTSKEFGMHSQSGYVTEIAPNSTAMVRLIYRPATMPVYGSVEREVYLTTNDPQKEKLVFAIKANVR